MAWPDPAVNPDVSLLLLELIVELLLEVEHLLLHGSYLEVGTLDPVNLRNALLYSELELSFTELVRIEF